MRHTAAAFLVVTPRMLDQDAAHDLRGHREEMGAILPLHPRVVDQPQVGLVDEGRRLQAVAGTLPFHVAAGQPVELVVDNGGQPFERTRVSGAPRAEQLRHLILGCPPGCGSLPLTQWLNSTAGASSWRHSAPI